MPDRAPPRHAARAVLGLRLALQRAADRLVPPEVAIFDAANAAGATHVLRAMAELGLADELAKGRFTAAELAQRLGLDADAVHRVLRAAATRDLVRLDRRGRFRLTRLGGPIATDHPRSVRPWILYQSSPATQAAWAGLAETVRTGEPAFPRVHGRSVWEHFAEHPEEEAMFAAGMRRLTEMVLPMIADGFPWPERGTVCDVAGGVGTLLAGILQRHPGLRGVLVDAPGVLREAEDHLRRAGVRDRVELSEGDIFAGLEARADVYLLKDVLHDWDDERCVRILRTVRAAMPAGAQLVAAETLQERDRPDAVASGVDLQMLTQTDGGRQRSASELHALFAQAGLRPGPVHLTAGPALVVGTPA